MVLRLGTLGQYFHITVAHTAVLQSIIAHTCSHLHTAFIDFKQAYDTIDRPHLWNHLNNIRMPTHLVNVIKQMYDGDKYVLIDGTKITSTGNSAVPAFKRCKTRLSFISSPLFPFYQ
jgi:hypothetical protein